MKVHNDILCAIDQRKSVFLVLLDLSAAFDTVNHQILLNRLFSDFGITGNAYNWFKSYLSYRTFYVSVQDGTSTSRSFDCGVPQGSVLGPILFSLYISPIANVISLHGLEYHLYADDTQLYISFPSSSSVELNIAKHKVEACVHYIDMWIKIN